MKYTRSQVKEIIKKHSKKLDAEMMIDNWMNSKANKPLNLSKYSYPLACYTFPITIDNVIQGEITLVSLYGNATEEIDMLMNKYLGEDFETSWLAFSHDTYLYAYLSITNKEFILPISDFSDTFYCFDGTFKDNNGKEIKYKISYGDYGDEKTEREKGYEYRDRRDYNDYYFLECGIILLIEKVEFSSNELGETINERIKKRK